MTAVGGTSLAVGASNNYACFETGWGTKRSTWTDNAWSTDPHRPGSTAPAAA